LKFAPYSDSAAKNLNSNGVRPYIFKNIYCVTA
jgi:hypothetical protein